MLNFISNQENVNYIWNDLPLRRHQIGKNFRLTLARVGEDPK